MVDTDIIMPRRGRPVQNQQENRTLDLTLDKTEYGYFNHQDPENPFYTDYEWWTNPNDAIKRRINNLDLSEFTDAEKLKKLANYEIPDIATMELNPVSFRKFEAAEYQSGRSNSDERTSVKIKGLASKLPSFQGYKPVDDLSWIVRKHRLLFFELLEHVTTKDLSKSTVEADLYAMLRVMKTALGSEYHILYAKYNGIYLMIRDNIRRDEGNNKLNKAERKKGGLIPWKMVLDKQKELENAFNAIGNKRTKEAYVLNQDLLLLSLYCLIPPLRAEVKTLQFADNPTSNWEDRSGNLILIEDDDIFLELHEIKKRHGYVKLDLPADLKAIIQQSYTLYKRKYAFTDTKQYPNLNKTTNIQSLDNRLKKLFNGYSVGSSMLRSSYVTYMFTKRPAINYNQKEDIAHRMRTSVRMLLTNYYKILDDEDVIEQDPLARQRPAQRVEGIRDDDYEEPEDDQDCAVVISRGRRSQNGAAAQGNDAYQRHKAKQKDYYQKNKPTILSQQKTYRNANPYEQNRRKIIYMLNNSETYRDRIRQATVDKYKIKKVDGQYV